MRSNAMIDENATYQALAARDLRFDGVFFVGVTSTGIYCRPICPAKTPLQKNCRFFASAEAAEKEAFRPCLRCRPELAPGKAPIDRTQRIAHLIAHRIAEGVADDGASMEDIASQFRLSSRQLRRILQKELGVSPIELLQTRRLLLAKQLLTETRLPITKIAFASGFSSLRRFNDAFIRQYRMPPSRLRKRSFDYQAKFNTAETSTLQLTYRPPYDWDGVLALLAACALKGVELVTSDGYARTVHIGKHKGWIKVDHLSKKHALVVEFTHSLTPVLPTLLGRVRNLFDLSARPDIIAAHLMKDDVLKKRVSKNPGLRVPGAFDGFEVIMQTILAQKVTTKTATTMASRFVKAFGQPIETPFPELSRLAPSFECIATKTVDEITGLGITSMRAKSIIALAQASLSEELRLEVGANPETTIKKLAAFPGLSLGDAHFIAMRTLHWPDAFPKEYHLIRNNLGGVTTTQAEEMSQAWRPWRSYAALYLLGNPA